MFFSTFISTPGKNLSVADMLSRSYTEAEFQTPPPKLTSQSYSLAHLNLYITPVHKNAKKSYIIKNMILADYSTYQFSIRINDKANDEIVKPLDFFFQIHYTFPDKTQTPIKTNNKSLHLQSVFLDETDVITDDEDLLYTRIAISSTA